MKKSWIALLALVLACVMLFAACGDKAEDKDEDNKAEETTSAVADDTTAAPVEEDTTAPVVTEPTVEEPSIAGGEKTYSMGDIEEGALVEINLLYDADGNIMALVYSMAYNLALIEDEAEIAEVVESLDGQEDAFNQFKDIGGNITIERNEENEVAYLIIQITVESELDAQLVANLFDGTNNGTSVKVADVEAGIKAMGLTEVTE